MWYEYFKDLFSHVDNSLEINTLAEHDVSCMLCRSVDDPVDDNHNDMLNKNITVSEIRDVINDLPDGKSGGIDGILYEMIQCGTDALITYHPASGFKTAFDLDILSRGQVMLCQRFNAHIFD